MKRLFVLLPRTYGIHAEVESALPDDSELLVYESSNECWHMVPSLLGILADLQNISKLEKATAFFFNHFSILIAAHYMEYILCYIQSNYRNLVHGLLLLIFMVVILPSWCIMTLVCGVGGGHFIVKHLVCPYQKMTCLRSRLLLFSINNWCLSCL